MKHSAQGFGKPNLKAIAAVSGSGANVNGFTVEKPSSNPHPFLAQKSAFKR